MPVVTRFDELPMNVLNMFSVMAKGVRNITGIAFQKNGENFIKYIGNVGQDLVEAVYSFENYESIPARDIVRKNLRAEDAEFGDKLRLAGLGRDVSDCFYRGMRNGGNRKQSLTMKKR